MHRNIIVYSSRGKLYSRYLPTPIIIILCFIKQSAGRAYVLFRVTNAPRCRGRAERVYRIQYNIISSENRTEA